MNVEKGHTGGLLQNRLTGSAWLFCMFVII
jgi:hypothetical protein